ncbi:MAG: SDR family oxidoreductase [Deltaproteobacteria bacterium]|nr:SDR family oxidoreductase [Deltaproteobacteria bacterium]
MITSMKDAFSVKGLNVLITGGNQGLGLGMADAFCQCEANVAIMARNAQKGEKVAEQLKTQYGAKVIYYQGDITKKGDPERVVENVIKDFGRIDVLINNAGITRFFDSIDADKNDFKDWHDVIGVDLNGTFVMSVLVAKHMRKQGWGSIINISSNAAEIVNLPQRMVSYSTAKAGVNRMTKMLAHEWAPHKIRVNAIAPGYTESDLTPAGGEELQSYIKFWTEHTPTGRWGKPIEIGAMAVYLASDASEQITGAVFTIDGGYSLAN